MAFSYPADHPLTAEFEEQMTALVREYTGEGEFLAVHHPDEPSAKDDAPDSTALALMAAKEGFVGGDRGHLRKAMSTGNITDPPSIMKNVTTFASFFKNGLYPVLLFILTPFLDIYVERYAAAIYSLLVIVYWIFAWQSRVMSSATQKATEAIEGNKIPDKDTRAFVIGLLQLLEWRYRMALLSCSLIIISIVIWFVGAWGYAAYRTKVPDAITFTAAEKFDAKAHLLLLTKAPFLEALTGYLEEEAKAEGVKSVVVLLRTVPFSHPTKPSEATLYFENQSFDLSGYAFRHLAEQRGEQYEPLRVTYPTAGKIVLQIPASNQGDTIFLLARVSLKHAPRFPDDIAAALKVTVCKETK